MGVKAKQQGRRPSALAVLARKVRQNAATDALLANWDVIGRDADNIMIKGSKIVKIDAGSAFHFRAQGGAKKYAPIPIELSSMKTSRGQLYHFFTKRATNHTLADYWGKQTARIAALSPKLRRIIHATKLPVRVKKAFCDRLQVFKALRAFLRRPEIKKALKSKALTWRHLDSICSSVLKGLVKDKKPLSGRKLQRHTLLKLLHKRKQLLPRSV